MRSWALGNGAMRSELADYATESVTKYMKPHWLQIESDVYRRCEVVGTDCLIEG